MEKLKIRIDAIPPDEGLEFDLAPEPERYGIDEVTVVNPPGVSGQVRVKRDRRDLLVEGRVSALLELECTRCLKPARVTVGGEFSFRMVPQEQAGGGDEVELQRDDLDVEFFDGETVDIGAIVAEQIYLGVPFRVLCHTECKGLCPECGQDLNERDCGHRAEGADPRWDALRSLKESN